MDFTGFSQWNGLTPFGCFYDPQSGLQYQVVTMLQPLNFLLEPIDFYSHPLVDSQSLEQANTQHAQPRTVIPRA